MNTVVEAQTKKFCEDQSLSGYTQDVIFEKFTIFAIEKGHLNSGIEPLDAHFEGSEYGIDGASIIVHGQLITDVSQLQESQIPIDLVEFHFFQSKTGNKFQSGEILKFLSAVEDFFEPNYVSKSDDLTALKEISDFIYSNSGDLEKNPDLRLYYATTGNYKMPDDIEKQKSRFQSRLTDTNLFSTIEINFVGAKDLQEWYRAATQSIKTTITFDQAVTLPQTTDIQQAYIGYIEAAEIIKLVQNKNSETINKTIFHDNIRDFNPDTDINKRISKSLREGEGNLFVFRNNGITAVAKKVRSTGNAYTVTDYQIVNGCQTSHILFENQDHLANVKVPFRLIEASDESSISSIIVGTNLQNEVKKEQFWALTSFMKNFEEFCSTTDDDLKIFIERRDSQYRGLSVEKIRIMSPNILLKAVTSFLYFVGNRAGRAYASTFKEYADRLFQDHHEVSIYHTAAFAHFRLESLWRKNRIHRKYKIFRYYILTAMGQALTQNIKLLEINTKDAKVTSQAITEFLRSDEKVEPLIAQITQIIEEVVYTIPIENGSLRDFIKSEAVGKMLNEKFLQIHCRLD